ncbi:hypothetical protein BDV19DRAFT_389581 [Aspergillus venezuelensis]
MDGKHEKGRSELSATAEDFVPTPVPSVATPATSLASPATNDASPVPPEFAELADDTQRPKSPEFDKRRCWDWVVVRGNSHYAKDRQSFSQYRPLEPGTLIAFCDHEPPATPVAGIGTVFLHVKPRPEEGRPVYRLTLRHVLHVPNAPCNGFAASVHHHYFGGMLLEGAAFAVDKHDYRWYYCVSFHGRTKLALAADPEGQSYIEGDATAYCLDMVLSDREMAEIRYRPLRNETKPRFSAPGISLPIRNRPSTTSAGSDG